ncbi:hypothetical protein OIV83_006038 [Microbotryomycetes sp. JL201]|nr:hypothetical protein OIV83_006038 [Microbotryomycetes sp. JL201]
MHFATLMSVAALVATLATDVSALPTRASTSTIARRARTRKLRRHTPAHHGVRAIVDDAEAYMQARSNVMLVKRQPLVDTGSTFTRVVRSLLGRASNEPVLAVPVVAKRQLDGVQFLSNRQAAALRLEPSSEAKTAPVAQPTQAEQVVAKRQVVVDDIQLQQAVYASAVAALDDSARLSSAAAALPTGSVNQVNAVADKQNDLAGPVKFAAGSTANSALLSEKTVDAPLEPITMTITLVEGPSGGYINQAALETATSSVPNPRSSSFVRHGGVETAEQPTSSPLAANRPTAVVKVRRMIKLHAQKARHM